MKNKPSRRTFLQSGLAIPAAGLFNYPLSLKAASPQQGGRRKSYIERLDPELEGPVKKMLEGPELDLGNPSQYRTNSALMAKQRIEFKGVTSKDHKIPGPLGAPELDIRIYHAEKKVGLTPILLWMHGGGYVIGDMTLNDLFCCQLALAGQASVASVNYRLAPEHPYPIPLEDCYATLKWLAAQADELQIDRSRICAGGASAGGGLAAGLALLARDRAEINLAWQLLISPMMDDRNTQLPSEDFPDTLIWTRTMNYDGWRAYLGHEPGSKDVEPYASPARAENLEGLAPAFIGTGDLDLFAEEGLIYARKLVAAGVPTEVHIYPGAPHAFESLVAPETEISKKFTNDMLWAYKRICNG